MRPLGDPLLTRYRIDFTVYARDVQTAPVQIVTGDGELKAVAMASGISYGELGFLPVKGVTATVLARNLTTDDLEAEDTVDRNEVG